MAHATVNGRNIGLGYYTDIISAALARVTFEQQCDQWVCSGQNENIKKLAKLGFKGIR